MTPWAAIPNHVGLPLPPSGSAAPLYEAMLYDAVLDRLLRSLSRRYTSAYEEIQKMLLSQFTQEHCVLC